MWYSGVVDDLWIEYKYVLRVPKRVPFIADLSPLQLDWGKNRYIEGRNVAVIVGHTDGGIILTDLAWTNPIEQPIFLSRRAIADWIMNITMASQVNAEAVTNSGTSVDGGA